MSCLVVLGEGPECPGAATPLPGLTGMVVTARVADSGWVPTVPWAKPSHSTPQAMKNLARKAVFLDF